VNENDSENGSFYGKFRGVVTDVHDPLFTCRIRARVPDVMGADESGWALPALPFGGSGMGFFALPSVGAGVWIEFEHGDPDFPIWSGAWWGLFAEEPDALMVPVPYQKTMIMTAGGHSITLDDTPGRGGITLETATGERIVLGALGIEISNKFGAGIKLLGPNTSINDGALEVT
jgi:uncharacterized protein involved in type VI secretion and phage assembly